jgi:hypothetical protein
VIGQLHNFWNDLWPNVIAPSAWTLAAITVSHVKRTAQAERHHREMKEHVTAVAGESPGPAITAKDGH